MPPVILIVDDDPDLRDLWQMAIEGNVEADILSAVNGDDALRILVEKKVNIIVSDFAMPHKNGGELFIYNSETENLPFILIMAEPIEEYPELKNFKEKNKGNRYFVKPMNSTDLGAHVKMLLKDQNGN